MNSGFRPIPPSMPNERAADLMVRRGECKSYGQAIAVIKHRRRRDYGRTEITPADKAAFANVEKPLNQQLGYLSDNVARPRAYKDDTWDETGSDLPFAGR